MWQLMPCMRSPNSLMAERLHASLNEFGVTYELMLFKSFVVCAVSWHQARKAAIPSSGGMGCAHMKWCTQQCSHWRVEWVVAKLMSDEIWWSTVLVHFASSECENKDHGCRVARHYSSLPLESWQRWCGHCWWCEGFLELGDNIHVMLILDVAHAFKGMYEVIKSFDNCIYWSDGFD